MSCRASVCGSVGSPSSTPDRAFSQAARHAGVVWLGLFTLGIGLGVLVTDHGLPWWLAPLISATVFAGSLEFLLVGMLAVAAPISALAVTALMVNSRHLFYGLSFPLHLVRGWRKAYSIYTLCDEAYALVTGARRDEPSGGRILWTQAGLHASWATGALVGTAAGATILGGLSGLDFILTALFLVLAMDAYRDHPDTTTLLIALAAGGAGALLADGSMMPVAMCVLTVALTTRHLTRRDRRRDR